MSFFFYFGGRLNLDNRWVVMASLIPWVEVETEYVKRLREPSQGSKASYVRFKLGSLIIKEKMVSSDEETVHSITENPHLQFFIGLHEFQEKASFNASSMIHLRKRFYADFINEIIEVIVKNQQKVSTSKCSESELPDDDSGISAGVSTKSSMESDQSYYQGKLMLDATCAPSDIPFWTHSHCLS